MNQTGGYQLNEKDIESVLNFLKLTDPENATPETAIDLLEYYKATFHNLAHEDLGKLKEVYKKLKKEKKLKSN
jgi:predicted solute-binding protein